MLATRLLFFAATLGALPVGGTPASAIEITGAGSTFAAPFVEALIAARAATDPETKVRYDAIGSGDGIRRFMADEVNFGATDRPMTDAEVAEVQAGVVHVPITAGMVVVAYNLPGYQGSLRLSRETLAGIFGGEIRKWNDPRILTDNPGATLPDRSVAVVVRRDASGTTFAFSNHLAAVDPAWATEGPGVGQVIDWPGGAITAKGNEGVAAGIAIAENSIGYVEYGFALRLGLETAVLENRAGNFVAANAASGAEALAESLAGMPADGRQTIPDPEGPNAYPIVSYSWFLLHQVQADAEVLTPLRDFVAFGLGSGQSLAAPIGYVPLPAPVATQAEGLLATLR